VFNLTAVKKAINDGEKVMNAASALRVAVKQAAAEEAVGGKSGYYYLRAVLQGISWDHNDFYKYICSPAIAKEFALKCLEFAEGQEGEVEADVVRLFAEAAQVDAIGTKKSKKTVSA
jgi:hypothetical protein